MVTPYRSLIARLRTQSEFQPRNRSLLEHVRCDVTTRCDAVRPFRFYQAIIWHYSDTGRLPDIVWACHTKGPSGQSNRCRTRYCFLFCFCFLGWPEQQWTRHHPACRPRSTQHTNFRHAKQTNRAYKGVINTWTVRPVVREIRYPMQTRAELSWAEGVAQSELIKWCEKWAGKAEAEQGV